MHLAVELDIYSAEILSPAGADHERLSRDNIHDFVQIMLRDAALVICQDAASTRCQPDFSSTTAWGSFAYMHMNGFISFVRPEEDAISSVSVGLI